MLIISGDMDAIGFIHTMLNTDDPATAVEQLDAGYAHGGGFRPFAGFVLHRPDKFRKKHLIKYPDDPALPERARIQMRDELVVVFDYGWVAVVQLDGSHVIARMD